MMMIFFLVFYSAQMFFGFYRVVSMHTAIMMRFNQDEWMQRTFKLTAMIYSRIRYAIDIPTMMIMNDGKAATL